MGPADVRGVGRDARAHGGGELAGAAAPRGVAAGRHRAHRGDARAGVGADALSRAEAGRSGLPRDCCIVNIPSLLRELILRISRIGVLDRKMPAQAHLISVLLDELVSVSDVPLQLPMPRDPRARRLAAALQEQPDDGASIAALSRRAGASRRTMERLFLAETKMTVGRMAPPPAPAARRAAAGRRRVGHATPRSTPATPSTSAFIAAFKRTFGTTPSRYATAAS